VAKLRLGRNGFEFALGFGPIQPKNLMLFGQTRLVISSIVGIILNDDGLSAIPLLQQREVLLLELLSTKPGISADMPLFVRTDIGKGDVFGGGLGV